MVINQVQAIDFQLDSPSEVNLNEEFSISINTETEDNFDIKVFVGDDNREHSEIYYEGNWESPYYYLKSAFPSQKNFKLIAHKSGESSLCVRLRKSGGSSFDEVCESITVSESKTVPESNNQDTKNINDAEDQESVYLEEPKNLEKTDTPPTDQTAVQTLVQDKQLEQKTIRSQQSKNTDKIILSTKEKPKTYISSEQKAINLMIYGFTFFCIILIVLFSLSKL